MLKFFDIFFPNNRKKKFTAEEIEMINQNMKLPVDIKFDDDNKNENSMSVFEDIKIYLDKNNNLSNTQFNASEGNILEFSTM